MGNSSRSSARHAVVADPRARLGGERGDPRVVAVEHDVAGGRRGDLAEQPGGRVDLAEAVELVAHDVEQQAVPRRAPARRSAPPTPRRVRRPRRRNGRAPVHDACSTVAVIAPRTKLLPVSLVSTRKPLAEHRRDHLRRRRLAVRAGDHDDALGQRGHRAREVAGEGLLDDQPGQRVAATADQPQRQQRQLAEHAWPRIGRDAGHDQQR